MLENLHFLLGHWTALDAPDGSSGNFTFAPNLLGRVILRTNFADYPATPNRSSSRHEDLMVIYVNEADQLRADYFDSEGHVIRYTSITTAANQITFVSERSATGLNYRLAYQLDDTGILHGTFEVAPPHQPDLFNLYLTWSARRVARNQNI
jgi:hypothetical protein